MGKNEKRGYAILAILFVVFSVIAFAVPFTKNAVFVLAYIFGAIAIAFQIYVFKLSFSHGEDAKSKFYGMPIANIGLYYLSVQLVISLIEMATAKFLPTWVAVVVNVIPLALALIGCITAEVMRDEIERQDVQLKKDVSNMRALQSMSASFVGMCSDDDMKKQLQNLADEFKYSDPVSSEDTKELESELQQMMKELQGAIIDSDMAAVKTLCMKVLAGLNERNRVCKLGK
ncbi:MAG: DUF308 domain-containing protein [Lachnospiraceae bacterium]|nr:DUF308 domain-containing protein [Lachnospiraceae bacterium]